MSKLNGKWINKDADNLTQSGDDLKVKFSDTEAPDINKVWSSAKVSTISGSLQIQIDAKPDSDHIHDGRYYTETEVDTISGSLQQQLDNKAETAVNLGIGTGIFASKSGMDLQFKSLVGGSNITLIDDGNNITLSGTIGGGGVTNHALLDNLDYASSAHTGFQPAGDYATISDLTVASGVLSDEIDADVSEHNSTADHTSHADVVVDGDFGSDGFLIRSGGAGSYSVDTNTYTTYTEFTTASGSLQIQIDAKPDADHTHAGGIDEMEYFTLSGGDVTNKFVALGNTPVSPAEVGMDIIGGCTQFYGVDYTVSGTQVIWNGFALDGVFEAGDEFRVMYSY